MKNFVGQLLFGRNAKVNFLLVLCVFGLIGLGCFGRSKEVKPIPAEFQGAWTGADGSTLTIRGDNSGDYKSGGTSIDNATVGLDETGKILQMTFFGVAVKEFNIDQAPSGSSMTLGGVKYTRSGGSTLSDSKKSDSNKSDISNKKDDSSSVSTKANAAKYEVPGDEEMQEMCRTALMDFNDAVQQGDFTDFHSKISKAWQRQVTPEKFNQVFDGFIQQKPDMSGVESAEAEFSPQPSVETDMGVKKLIAKGTYNISPRQVMFTLKWIPEGKEWKLFGIEVELPAVYR